MDYGRKPYVSPSTTYLDFMSEITDQYVKSIGGVINFGKKRPYDHKDYSAMQYLYNTTKKYLGGGAPALEDIDFAGMQKKKVIIPAPAPIPTPEPGGPNFIYTVNLIPTASDASAIIFLHGATTHPIFTIDIGMDEGELKLYGYHFEGPVGFSTRDFSVGHEYETIFSYIEGTMTIELDGATVGSGSIEAMVEPLVYDPAPYGWQPHNVNIILHSIHML